jgi:translation initiation factor IF-3
VCKIVDYSKYRYAQEKKAKEVKKNSKTVEIKEVKMSYKIDSHDYDVRRNNASKFLAQGNRVKCTVQFRGREVTHDALGYDLLNKLALDLDAVCNAEGRPKREGRNLSLILSPKIELLKKLNENRRAAEKLKKQQKIAKRAEKTSRLANGEVLDDDEDDDDDDDDDDDNDDLEETMTDSSVDDEDEEDNDDNDDLEEIMADSSVDDADDDMDDEDGDENDVDVDLIMSSSEDDDDPDDVSQSLDELLSGDKLTKELFSQ